MGAVRPAAARQGLPVGALTTSCHSGSLRASPLQAHLYLRSSGGQRQGVSPPPPPPCWESSLVGSSGHSSIGRLGEKAGHHHLGRSQLAELCRPESYPRMLGTGCQRESRQHQCAFVDWPLPPVPATAATARRWGERRLPQGCLKGPSTFRSGSWLSP